MKEIKKVKIYLRHYFNCGSDDPKAIKEIRGVRLTIHL